MTLTSFLRSQEDLNILNFTKLRYFLSHWLNSCQIGIDNPLGQFQVYCVSVTLIPLSRYQGHRPKLIDYINIRQFLDNDMRKCKCTEGGGGREGKGGGGDICFSLKNISTSKIIFFIHRYYFSYIVLVSGRGSINSSSSFLV